MIVWLAWNRSTLHQFGERAPLLLPTVGEEDGTQESRDVGRPGRTQRAPVATGVYPVSDTFASAASPCPVAARRRMTFKLMYSLQHAPGRAVAAARLGFTHRNHPAAQTSVLATSMCRDTVDTAVHNL